MVYIRDTEIDGNQKTAIALGNFDGLHGGHQKLMAELTRVSAENGLLSMVFSFFPHPQAVLHDKKSEIFYTMMTADEKMYILEQMGIDILVEYPFTIEFSQLSAEQFVTDILVEKLRCSVVVVGENFRFGKKHAGDVALLRKMSGEYGFEVCVVDTYRLGNIQVSSTEIRKRLLEKDFTTVQQLLTRPYFAMGYVVEGRKVGRTIGFPTVNLVPEKTKLLPPNGVYATHVLLDGKRYDAVTNIGVKPTYGGLDKTIESHIIGYSKTAYGRKIVVFFLHGIRDEQKFDSVEALRKQISMDVSIAKSFLETCNVNIDMI